MQRGWALPHSIGARAPQGIRGSGLGLQAYIFGEAVQSTPRSRHHSSSERATSVPILEANPVSARSKAGRVPASVTPPPLLRQPSAGLSIRKGASAPVVDEPSNEFGLHVLWIVVGCLAPGH